MIVQDLSVNAVDLLLKQETATTRPFIRWHLRRKFCVMDGLFRRYLAPDAKFADIGCGQGDALVLASLCASEAELWGLDMDSASLQVARKRLPSAILHQGDMHDPQELPKEYFDVVHEFGAAFLSRGWDILARAYLSLLKDGGILLWELPQRYSLAHIAYLLTLAPRKSEDDSRWDRLFRSLNPSKYRFESDASVMRALQMSGYEYEILERVSIGSFYFPKYFHGLLDWGWKLFGDRMFDVLDSLTKTVLQSDAGYYLAIRKKSRVASDGDTA